MLRTLALVGLGMALSSGCAALSTAKPTGPRLFPASAKAVDYDFEGVKLTELPQGFERLSGGWSVANSPSAASGEQLLAIETAEPAVLTVNTVERADEMRAEVAVRIYVGSSGAGIGCRESKGTYVVSVEPESNRVALYSRGGGTPTLLKSHEAPVRKGSWARVGILCRKDLVTAYLDGHPVATHETTLTPDVLALYAGDGIIAQFDDLRIAGRK